MEGSEMGVMEIGVKEEIVVDREETGVYNVGVMEGVVIGGVMVEEGFAPPPATPPDPKDVQLRSSQQPFTPSRTTQWRPGSQLPPSEQHSPPCGAQVEAPQQVRPVSQAPPLLQQVSSLVTQVPSSQQPPSPLSGQHLPESTPERVSAVCLMHTKV